MIDHTLLKYYLKPRSFEYYGRSSIYVFIGVLFFKKYVPTSGDWVYKYWNKKHLDFTSGERYDQLLKFEMQTRKWELGHFLGMFVFIIITLFANSDYGIADYIFVGFLFLVINVYPIALQRHNRIRILNVLEEQHQQTPYD